MAEKEKHPDIAKMSFEEALGELQEIVRQLEKGESKLDEAIGQYSRGAALRKHCEDKLREAQARVDKIVLTAEGAVTSKPADLD